MCDFFYLVYNPWQKLGLSKAVKALFKILKLPGPHYTCSGSSRLGPSLYIYCTDNSVENQLSVLSGVPNCYNMCAAGRSRRRGRISTGCRD